MDTSKTILILDDDAVHLMELAEYLESLSCVALRAENVEEARSHLQSTKIDFAIVDLYLDADSGPELSNDFIRDDLVPAKVRYGRMTSAPGQVASEFRGEWVMHKKLFWRDNNSLWPFLEETVLTSQT